MDGTLLNTENLYTEAASDVLAQFGTGPLTWDVKIRLQGLPGIEATKIIIKEYEVPATPEEFMKLSMSVLEKKWHRSAFLPGALELLNYLEQKGIPMALGTSSNTINFQRKTNHLQHGFKHFGSHIVTGDDDRIGPGRGKPHPDIWHVCLNSINRERVEKGLNEIEMEDCLIFEDGVVGVLAGVAARAYVIWIPDKEALRLLAGKEKEIIADSGEIILSLENFDIKYLDL
ncbi:uncharacterized protein PRCAT00001217001 [Priceomyces carsonii]|uniref:uncharacterized protein n=1 Tax=Priceomyces carsonii TaxID=28549 RepID=UPI002EDAB3D3|nr:unnamed protein product [Priceomyces carsonii]